VSEISYKREKYFGVASGSAHPSAQQQTQKKRASVKQCKKTSNQQKIWQSYCKNKMVQLYINHATISHLFRFRYSHI